ncbi:hypothetical protein ACW95P_01265 [Candidatus Mycoplasma pogonae]
MKQTKNAYIQGMKFFEKKQITNLFFLAYQEMLAKNKSSNQIFLFKTILQSLDKDKRYLLEVEFLNKELKPNFFKNKLQNKQYHQSLVAAMDQLLFHIYAN